MRKLFALLCYVHSQNTLQINNEFIEFSDNNHSSSQSQSQSKSNENMINLNIKEMAANFYPHQQAYILRTHNNNNDLLLLKSEK